MAANEEICCFGGKEVRKIDSASRVSIPASFRSRLGQTVYLLKSLSKEPCVIIYSEEGWQEYYKNLSNIYEGKLLTKFQRRSVGNVDMAVVDKCGRIVLKKDVLDFTGITEEALVVCYPDRVEIWNEQNWLSAFEDDDDDEGVDKWVPTK